MTDPLTLLAERPPAVPAASAGARAAARAVLEAAIRAETGPTGRPGRPERGRRGGGRRVLVGAAAAAGLAVVAATGVALWPSATPPASAAWAPEPGRLSPAELDVVDAGCRSVLDGEEPAALDLVHVDRRGGTALAFYEGGAGAVRSQCFATRAGTTWQVEGTRLIAMVAPPEDGWLGVDHLLDVAVGAGPSGYTWAAGAVDDEVARAEIERGGEPLEASLDGGYFSAFWPTEQEPGDVTVRLYDGADALLLEYVYTEEAIAEDAADDIVRAIEGEVVAPEPGG